jgi:hypothetical protein
VGLLVVLLAVLAAPLGHDHGSTRPSGATVLSPGGPLIPAAVQAVPRLVRSDPAASAALPLGMAAVTLLLFATGGWRDGSRQPLAILGRLLAALHRGRGPPSPIRSTTSVRP